jgi:hypothetical protein
MGPIDEDAALRFAQLCADAIAMNDAALVSDSDEARFRARMIADWALDMGRATAAGTASHIERFLGPCRAEPGQRYVNVMRRLAKLMTGGHALGPRFKRRSTVGKVCILSL